MSRRQRKNREVVVGSGAEQDGCRSRRGIRYHRISNVSQEDGYSLAFQSDKTKADSERCGVVVPDDWCFDEVRSGADGWRPKYRRVWDLVGSGKVGHVFAYDTSRLARDPLHVGLFIRHCKENGVAVHFADGSSVDTVMDEVIQYLKGFFGYQEREDISKRTMDGKRKAAKDNRMPNGCGQGVYGYDYDKFSGEWVMNDFEAKVVRESFLARLSGVSACAITRGLNDLGIPSKQGGPWSGGVMVRLLRKQWYTGSMWWGQKRYETVFSSDGGPKRQVSVNPESEWIWLEDFAPRIIEPWLFKAVQEAMDRNPRRGKGWDYILSEFFVCGECDSPVSGSTQYWNGETYPYYRCEGTAPTDYRPKVCGEYGKRADKLEPAVLEPILALARNPGEIVADLKRMSEGGGAKLDQRKADLLAKVKKHRRELANVTMQQAKGWIDQQLFESLAAPINHVLAGLDKELAILEGQRKSREEWARTEERVRAAFANITKSLGELDYEGLKRLLRLLNVKVIGGPGKVLVTGLLDPSLFTIAQTSALSHGYSRRRPSV